LLIGSAGAAAGPPLQLSSEQDHQRMMELLHITDLRRGPDGDEHLAAPRNGVVDLGHLEVGERVVAAVAGGANCEHGSQR